MPEIARLRTVMDGPAGRHSPFGCNPAEEAEPKQEEETADNSLEPASPADEVEMDLAATDPTDDLSRVEQLNDFETIIGFDTQTDEPAVQHYRNFQNKFTLLEIEAAKAANRAAKDTETPPTVAVAAEEHCCRIVVALQDVAKKLRGSIPVLLRQLSWPKGNPRRH